MYKIEKLVESHIEGIINSCDKSHFQYHEYSFLDTVQLSNYFSNRVKDSIEKEDTFAYVLSDNDEILGTLICEKNNFDSEMFGFNCYRITSLLVFSSTMNETKLIIDKLTSYLENELLSYSKKVYLTISLNNNVQDMDYLFNSLVSNNYYFIHTLLTFTSNNERFETSENYPNENLIIREATNDDALQVAALAHKSFKYSRFHLDPFLDNEKASVLLKNSAMNSILHGFVDVMFVAEINDKIVGYYSAKKRFVEEFNKTIGEVVISAVDSDYRGLGLFGKLDSHIINWFSDNTDFAEMGTYLVNYPVHKSWINKGFGLKRGTHQFSKLVTRQ